MKQLIKIYSYLIAFFALPFAFYARVPIHAWHYYYCAIFVSKIPFLFGDIFREWFYKVNLKEFGKGSRVMFGAVIQTRDCIIGSDVFIGNYSMISHSKIGNDTMIGPNTHIISGPKSHGINRTDIPMRLQKGEEKYIRV